MIRISNRQRRVKVDRERLRRRAERLLNLCGLSGAELSLLLTADPLIRELNRDYRGQDRPTDVLSFPQADTPEELNGNPSGPAILGDVVVSLETADRQARERGFSLEEELDRLIVHGLLHLVGYDHERGPREAARMRRKERALLAKLDADSPLD